jgi:hypothetical protein
MRLTISKKPKTRPCWQPELRRRLHAPGNIIHTEFVVWRLLIVVNTLLALFVETSTG